MADFEQLQRDVRELQREMKRVSSMVRDGQYSDRWRLEKPLVIAKATVLQLEEKDSNPAVADVGDMIVEGGKLKTCRAANTWVSAGMNVRDIAAGTAADSPTDADTLIRCSTSAGQALTVTLPEAASNLALLLVFTFVTDGGQSITINRTGSDTINDAGDLGNTSITLDDAGDTIAILSVQDNIWAVLNNIGCTLA